MPDNNDETLENGSIVGKRFKVLQKLGEGGCGAVFKVEDIEEKGSLYALKVEFNSANVGNVLKMEVQILSQLIKKRHVAKCIASGKRHKFTYMVMTLLGESLESIVDKHGPFLNVSSQMRIGICLLFGIKQIHDIGYLHRDLKPANVALGYKGSFEERYFLVIDFGLARSYITEDENGKKILRRPRDRPHFRGTARYCSVAMHDRFEQGRVDDLWALVYILAELRCKLPWNDLDDKEQIGPVKRKTPDESLFAKSPVQMLEFVNIVRNTGFYDRPDYEKLFKLLDEVMKKADYKWSDPYHWEPEHKKNVAEKKKKKNKDEVADSTKKVVNAKANTPKTKTDSFETDVPYFTLSDFKANPIGF